MAGIPLNVFKTVIKMVQRPNKFIIVPPVPPATQPTFGGYSTDTYFDGTFPNWYPPGPNSPGNASFLVYKAPLGVTSVMLYAQVASTATVTKHVSLWHYRPDQTKNLVPFPVAFTTLVQEIPVPTNDALVVIAGKLVLETGDQLYISSNDVDVITPVVTEPSQSVTDLKLTLSVLESANQ